MCASARRRVGEECACVRFELGPSRRVSQSGRAVIFWQRLSHTALSRLSSFTRAPHNLSGVARKEPERRAWVIGGRARRANAFNSSPATQISSFLLRISRHTSQGWVTQARVHYSRFCNSPQFAKLSLLRFLCRRIAFAMDVRHFLAGYKC